MRKRFFNIALTLLCFMMASPASAQQPAEPPPSIKIPRPPSSAPRPPEPRTPVETPEPPTSSSAPTEPPAPGQPLIEWNRPEILDYEIAPDRVNNVSSCREDDFFYLDQTARTCAPLLAMMKLYVQFDFAAHEAKSRFRRNQPDAAEYRAKAMGFAEQIIAGYGTPEWPLQSYLLSKTYQLRAGIYESWNEWDAAIADQDRRMTVLENSQLDINDVLYAQAFQQKGDYLLAKGDRTAARANYEKSFALNKSNAFEPFSSLQRHTEAMVKDAIFAREYDQALFLINGYLGLYHEQAEFEGKANAFDGEILLSQIVSMKIYIYAATGQKAQMVDATFLYQDLYKGREIRCSKVGLFPRVIAPYHKDESIGTWLSEIGCSDEIIAAMDTVPTSGITGFGDAVLLPPH